MSVLASTTKSWAWAETPGSCRNVIVPRWVLTEAICPTARRTLADGMPGRVNGIEPAPVPLIVEPLMLGLPRLPRVVEGALAAVVPLVALPLRRLVFVSAALPVELGFDSVLGDMLDELPDGVVLVMPVVPDPVVPDARLALLIPVVPLMLPLVVPVTDPVPLAPPPTDVLPIDPLLRSDPLLVLRFAALLESNCPLAISDRVGPSSNRPSALRSTDVDVAGLAARLRSTVCSANTTPAGALIMTVKNPTQNACVECMARPPPRVFVVPRCCSWCLNYAGRT